MKKKSSSWKRRLLSLLMAVVLTATLSGVVSEETLAASKLTVKATSKTVNVGSTVTLKSNKKVKWSVSKGKKYAKLTSKKSKSVKVKGLKTGTTVIKAKAGSKTKNITIKVIPALKVTATSNTIEVGKTVTLKSNNSAKWSVSAGADVVSLSSVASKSVVVTGKKAGSATVTVKDAKTGASKKVTITVKQGAQQDQPETPEEPETPAEPETPVEEEFVPQVATAEEVNAILDGTDTDTVLVDARPQEAYAGWALQGAKNGGHLKNAILYSARWFNIGLSESKLASKLSTYNEAIELCSTCKYIVYDYAGKKDAAITVAKYFHEKGIEDVKVFDAKDLIDEGTNLESYKNYDRYIPAEIVKDISDYITEKDDTLEPSTTAVISKEDIDSGKVVLFDISYGNVHESKYLSYGHVPGAIHMNTNVYERPRSYVPEKKEKYSIEYSLIPLEEFRDSVCTQYGITKDSIVIGISDSTDPIARFGYMLRSLGVKYYGMSGLMNAWEYNGYKLENDVVRPTSVESFGTDTISNPEEIVWMDEVKEILEANDYDENKHVLGTIVGGDKIKKTYSYHDLMGKIPGTFDATEGISIFENPDGTPPMKQLILNYYEANGIPTDKLIVHFCGDGWGASSDAYNAQAVDLDFVKYWGEGWVVWSDQGNWFIDYAGRKIRYDKYLDEVVDEDGNIVSDGKNFKLE